jgi:hypothetical protein
VQALKMIFAFTVSKSSGLSSQRLLMCADLRVNSQRWSGSLR